MFLKAALDNDQNSSNFAVPFDEDKYKAFKIGPTETNAALMSGLRKGINTAPVDVTGKR